MKVIHIITGLTQGGAESALYRLITNRFNKKSVTHIVVSMVDFGVYGKQLENKGIEVHQLKMPRSIPTLNGIFKLWRLIRKIRPDIIQTWMYHSDLIGGLIARIAGNRNVLWGIVNFNLDPAVAGKSTRWTAKTCAFLSGLIPQKIVSCSQRAVIAHQQIGYSPDKFVTIPLGYDLDEFKRNQAGGDHLRKIWGVREGSVVIGCIARWDRQKDHQNFLHALAKVRDEFPEVYCVLAGPWMDQNNQELVNLIAGINGNDERIILAGKVESIPDTMSALDLHILPSLGEAFPNVVAEAMACGTPCIVTDVGDAATIVSDLGWVVPRGKSDMLAESMRAALYEVGNITAWKQRGQACRQRIIDNYSMLRMVEAYEDLWHKVIDKTNYKA